MSETISILAVDDTATVRRLVEINLSRQGFTVATAETGAGALKDANSLRPDIILLDLNLPDMHGFEVLEALKKNPVTKNIPVLIATGDASANTVKEALVRGATDYIIKPFNFKVIANKAKSLFEKQKTQN